MCNNFPLKLNVKNCTVLYKYTYYSGYKVPTHKSFRRHLSAPSVQTSRRCCWGHCVRRWSRGPLPPPLLGLSAFTFELRKLTDVGESFCELELYILSKELCNFKTKIDESTYWCEKSCLLAQGGCPHWSIDQWSSHCVSFTCFHPIIKRVNNSVQMIYPLFRKKKPSGMVTLTHTYPHVHKPPRENKVTMCNHQADSPLYAQPDVWSDDFQV